MTKGEQNQYDTGSPASLCWADSKYEVAYVRFTAFGSVVGYGYIIPKLWPNRLAVSWEAVDPPNVEVDRAGEARSGLTPLLDASPSTGETK